MLADEEVEVRAARLLLALEDDLHVDRQTAGLSKVRLDGLEVNEELALVVGGAAREQLLVADGRLERWRRPLVERIDRLDVVVAVDEHRRRPRGAEPLAIDDRMAWRVDESRAFEPDGAHVLCHPLGAAADVTGVFGNGADARNGQKGLQFVEVAGLAGLDEIDDSGHGRLQ